MSTPLPLFAGLLDDASVFPPGSLPLERAVREHAEHRASPYAWLVGPMVVAEAALPRVGDLVDPAHPVEVSLTAPGLRQLGPALHAASGLPGVRVRSVEAPLEADTTAGEVVPVVREALVGHPGVQAYVEVPRDERREDVVAALAGTPHRAKVRTGGVRADLYPDAEELAATLAVLVTAGVPFKATAGLHHALANTDPETGFDQHGFLNVIAAVDLLLGGGTESEAAGRLAEREAATVTGWALAATERSSAVRSAFTSFGTCSIADPRDELTELGFGLDHHQGAEVDR